MKITAIVLSLLVCAFAAQAQTVVLDYNMNQTPDLQGFSLAGSCSNVWSAAGGILQFRDCVGGSPWAFARNDNLLVGATTVQVDARMRILDSDPNSYAFEFMLGRNNTACYCKVKASDFGDTQWHDLTLFYNYGANSFASYVDGNPVAIDHVWAGNSTFIIGDGNSGYTWGNVDFSSLKVTVGYEHAVTVEHAAWGAIKGLYR